MATRRPARSVRALLARDGRPERRAFPAVAGALLAALAAWLPEAAAQSTLHMVDGLDAGGQFGAAGADVGDLDGDAGADFAVAAIVAAHEKGEVRVYSGRTGAQLLHLTGDEVDDRFGAALAGLGDTDGDGVPDFAVGAPADVFGGLAPGRVVVVSGADGSPLWQVPGGQPGERYGNGLARLPDVDGDGVDELAVSAPGHDDGATVDAGRIVLHSGATGAELWSWTGPHANAGTNGIAAVGDLDGDGTADLAAGFVIGGQPDGGVRVLSGADGSLVVYLEDVLGIGWGEQVAPAGDVDGDGTPDVAMTSLALGGTARVGVFSGDGSGLLIEILSGGVGFSLFGYSLATPDLDGDGVRELLVGAPLADVPGVGTDTGVVRAYSATTGGVVATFAGLRPYDRLGQSLAAVDDADGDGTTDLLIGATQVHPTILFAGYARLVSGVPGPWVGQGGGVGAAGGAPPALTGSGTLNAGAPVALALTGAPPGASSTLVVGLSVLAAPFKGGTMVPQPLLLVAGLPVDGAGAALSQAVWPAGVPSGLGVAFQHWIEDAAGPAGYVASDGLVGTTP